MTVKADSRLKSQGSLQMIILVIVLSNFIYFWLCWVSVAAWSFLIWEDPTCLGATNPVRITTIEPVI